jgi:hypothetical protein
MLRRCGVPLETLGVRASPSAVLVLARAPALGWGWKAALSFLRARAAALDDADWRALRERLAGAYAPSGALRRLGLPCLPWVASEKVRLDLRSECDRAACQEECPSHAYNGAIDRSDGAARQDCLSYARRESVSRSSSFGRKGLELAPDAAAAAARPPPPRRWR